MVTRPWCQAQHCAAIWRVLLTLSQPLPQSLQPCGPSKGILECSSLSLGPEGM